MITVTVVRLIVKAKQLVDKSLLVRIDELIDGIESFISVINFASS